MQTVTLHADDFKTVHNTLCELRSLAQDMYHRMVKVEEVERIIAQFEQGLANAYAQDNAQFEAKFQYFDQFRMDNKLRSIWSVYELNEHGFVEQHPFTGALQVAYRDHWGDEAVFEEIEGHTWADLYRAADRAIRRSGDDHHVFIEQFYANPECPTQLILQTGS